MLLMERVGEIGIDEARISEESVRVARQALMRETARSARPEVARRPRRRIWAGVGIGGLVASTAVTAIIVGSVLAPPAVPDAAAAEILEHAATATVDAQDASLSPGQFLRIETVGEHLQFWNSAWADDGDENTDAFNASRSGADAAVLVRDTRVLYVPADRSTDWFYDWGHAEVIESFGERGAEAADAWSLSPGPKGTGRGVVETLPAGEYLAEGGDTPPMPYLADRYRPFYAEMPREPQALLDWLRAQSGMTGTEADRWVAAGLSDPSAINLMPADLRASFFRAIALMPGFEVVAEDSASATLQYVVPGHRTTTIVIDTHQGLVLSIAENYGSGGPAGDTQESVTRVVTSVVGSAPAS
ncbi:hypothetical protein [Microbacterium sp. W4I20]|uniref:hypothetical protein n=1 Tax=Microbacterium sp. W4I20 TaxID=3042262 RepID=UPI0027872573|nr:hypothetical protein [Microbacterium sp. W4I20]MDQ0725079.1 hypothetical protein [Microbacterium sp. W4I20]